MTHSIDARTKNKNDALRLMAVTAEDEMILTRTFSPTDPAFQNTYSTAWTELEKENLIEPANTKGPIEYRLAGYGWIEGLRVSPRWEEQDFREKAGVLSKTLKRHVKGRNDDDALVPFNEVVQQSQLLEGFVYNAVESHLLRELNNSHDAEWADTKNFILIPRTFGLSLNPDNS
jgi:hypothetical protein